MFPLMFEVTDSAGCCREAELFKQQADLRVFFLCTEYNTSLIIIWLITKARWNGTVCERKGVEKASRNQTEQLRSYSEK